MTTFRSTPGLALSASGQLFIALRVSGCSLPKSRPLASSTCSWSLRASVNSPSLEYILEKAPRNGCDGQHGGQKQKISTLLPEQLDTLKQGPSDAAVVTSGEAFPKQRTIFQHVLIPRSKQFL